MSETATAAPRMRLSELARTRVPLRATYDAAQTNDDNVKHWSAADDLSANAAHSPSVRRILRRRSRYEVANNSIAKGIVATKADYTVGTGPTLQVLTADEGYNQAVESGWSRWAVAVRLAAKLWQMSFSEIQDGEAFALLTNNPRLTGPVKLDVRLIEADQVASPTLATSRTDGIIFDDFGNPAGYTILKNHPGELLPLMGLGGEYDTVGADAVLHLFKCERPGQTRGVPQITPALPLFALLRRFTLAVVAAAETAANLAGILKSSSAAGDPDEIEPLEAIEIVRNMLLTMPQGWDMSQFRAEQPQTTYEMFKRALTSEACRCLGMPYNVAAADSSEHNFASGKLDHLPWFKALAIDWDRVEDMVVERTFAAWYAEASRIAGYLPAAPTADAVPAHTWFWDGQELFDPREAGAKATALEFGFDSYQRLFAKRGLDWKTEMKAQADVLGISFDEYQRALRAKLFGANGTDLTGFAETYAAAVRAGLVTPNVDDEIEFRKRWALPPVNDAVRRAWNTNNGARQPVTLKSPEAANDEGGSGDAN